MTSKAARIHALFFLVALLGGMAAALAAPVSPSMQSCVTDATEPQSQIATTRRRSMVSTRAIWAIRLPVRPPSPGIGTNSLPRERLQRTWARKRTLAAVPQFLKYASADIKVQRQKGRIVYGRATLPKEGLRLSSGISPMEDAASTTSTPEVLRSPSLLAATRKGENS